MNFDELMTENAVLRQKLARRERKSASDKLYRRTIGVRVPAEIYNKCALAARNTNRTMYRFTLDAIITELYRCPRENRTARDRQISHGTRQADCGDLPQTAADCGDLPPWEEARTDGTSAR